MLRNIDFRGGNNCIELKGAQYITFNQCDIGRDAILGIRVTRSGETESNYGIISNCAIDSGYNFSYSNRSNATLEDGLLLRDGANNWSVRNNLFKNWGHASIMLISNDDAYTVNHNEFYDNEITAPDVSYCRAIGTEGQTVGDCQGNKFYRNYIHNLSQKTQILGNANEIYYNVFAEIANTSLTEAVGIDLQAYGSFICNRNKIYNNTFVNIEGPAVRLWVDGGTKDIENNEIINNIMFNCGYKSNIGQDYALWIDSDAQVKANTYKNNLMYTPGISHIVYCRGAERTISEFNSENGNDDDVVNNNIQIEPLFKDPDSGNLALQSCSPCIDAGIDVNLTQDFSGSPIPKGESVDIGAFEYQKLVRPRNFRIVFP